MVTRCEKVDCYNNGVHAHTLDSNNPEWLHGHVRYSPTNVTTKQPTCYWTTANSLTDYQIVQCWNKATHYFTDEAGDDHLLCLAHADLYRTINEEMPCRLNE